MTFNYTPVPGFTMLNGYVLRLVCVHDVVKKAPESSMSFQAGNLMGVWRKAGIVIGAANYKPVLSGHPIAIGDN